MTKTLNEYVAVYKEQLEKGDIQKAYMGLVKYVLNVKTYLSKRLSDKFAFGNASLGYMDYTYFPFSNEFLRGKDLRFGIVLNHNKVRFELWLMGRNAKIQSRYWEVLKTTKWNENQAKMPKYSILEVVLVENPNFDNLEILSQSIEEKILHFTEEIMAQSQKSVDRLFYANILASLKIKNGISLTPLN